MSLKNKHRYTLQRLNKLLFGIPLTLLAVIVPKKPNIVLTSALNQIFNDNARALFLALYDDPDYKGKVYFVLNDKRKREQLNKSYPGRFISNRSWKDLHIILGARYWCSSALEMPAPGLFNRHLRTVYHLGHGMPYKRAGLAEAHTSWYKKLYYKLVFTNISYTWCTTPFFLQEIQTIYHVDKQRIKILPQPKTGCLAKPRYVDLPEFKRAANKHVLYAPTWRPFAETQLFPFNDCHLGNLNQVLRDTNIYIWLRLHPRYIRRVGQDILKHDHIKVFSPTEYPEANHYMHYFDALITDYSSLLYDYLRLHRPIWFFDYDIDIYKKVIGLIQGYKKVKVRPSITSQEQFTHQLKRLACGNVSVEARIEIDNVVNYQVDSKDIDSLIIHELFA